MRDINRTESKLVEGDFGGRPFDDRQDLLSFGVSDEPRAEFLNSFSARLPARLLHQLTPASGENLTGKVDAVNLGSDILERRELLKGGHNAIFHDGMAILEQSLQH